MDWNLLGLSFIVVFLAELGDKSQLAAITLSGKCQHPRGDFLRYFVRTCFSQFIGGVVRRRRWTTAANTTDESHCRHWLCSVGNFFFVDPY